MYIHLAVPMKVESQNSFHNTRGFYAQKKYTHYKKNWEVALEPDLTELMCNKKVKEEFKKPLRRTIIVLSKRNRILDYGNLIGGAKPIFDVLQDYGILKDDCPKYLDDHYFQAKVSKEEESTEIFIFLSE